MKRYYFVFLFTVLVFIGPNASAQMKGNIGTPRIVNGKAVIKGWACFKGSTRQVNVHFYAGTSNKNRKFLGWTRANRGSESGVKRACSSKGNHRFQYTLSDYKLNKFKGQKIWAFAIRPNKALGHSGVRTIPLPPEETYSISKVSESYVKSQRADFDYERKADFNNDGVLDIVQCQGTPKKTKNGRTRFHHQYEKNVSIKIINGKTRKQMYSYSFEGFKRDARHTRRIINTSCEIAFLEKNKPSVVIGSHFENYYNNNKNAPKYRAAPQRIILNQNGRLHGQVIKHSNKNYLSVTKDVKCQTIDHHRVSGGSYCFFSSYPTFEYPNKRAGVTFTSLLRFTRNGTRLGVNDLTKKVGLPWDGVRGTNVAKFPNLHNGPHYGKRRENANVISGDFIDYRNNGTYDLFVVGQHMSFYQFKMVIDTRQQFGFKFTKTYLTRPSAKGGPTEYTKVRAFPDSISKKCIYVSGEGKSIAGSINYVDDHLRCYKNSKWVKVKVPGNFTSNSYNAQFVEKGKSVLIRTKKRHHTKFDKNFTYFEMD